ncbi:NAD(P)-binding domain-containing protein [Yinghuangia sp. ASG 101]|uniref:ketopantoate reductase family protein n=1 Tax=Yinghuangia sp. ASG 101 TaxID=2896848 RepID=UPI001E565664|nr:2-dehydropantoate 2-reductase N-terminal domain-containing protein [Yinghuangia sp. ASG 101]UGQ12892.1 NAD(P)-binding domain-containing protein [Yinghuangia sp. ASG 101]
MRFIVHGAGAIGGLAGGRLHAAGHEVVLIARGAHGTAMRERGLRIVDPDGSRTVAVNVVERPDEIAFADGDVVLLSVKTQDTVAALRDLALAAPATTPVVCAQNGVANEDFALRAFDTVYGMTVNCPALYLEPGVVRVHSAPVAGLFDLGRYPSGVDDTAAAIAAALSEATFLSEVRPDIMRWKYGKLRFNIANAVEALCGPGALRGRAAKLSRAEADACYAAAGIEPLVEAAGSPRRTAVVDLPVGGTERVGGSTYQSLLRGTGATEVDYLNGEIARLGRLHGVPTPVNTAVQRLANEHARDRVAPGTLTDADILRAAGLDGDAS